MHHVKRDDDPVRDRPFNCHRIPKTAPAADLVADLINQLEKYEEFKGLRKRRRKDKDQDTFKKVVAAVVCDVIHGYLINPEQELTVALSKRVLGHVSRYRPLWYGKVFSAVLERLAAPEMAFIVMTKGARKEKRRTTIKAGCRLINRIVEYQLQPEDFMLDDGEEVVLLKSPKEYRGKEKLNGKLLEYDDDPTTDKLRREMRVINRWIADAQIAYLPIQTMGGTTPGIDTSQRRLQRHFNNASFCEGGRLFGGFWQSLKKSQRSGGLYINGERVVTLDYSNMLLRLLYSLEGLEPPEGDGYMLPGLEMCRRGVKKAFSALPFLNRESRGFPGETGEGFPDSVKWPEVVDKMKQAHPQIAHHFFTGIGYGMMYLESCIMVDVLLTLKEWGIVALPVHDAVVVPESAATVATEVMLDIFRNHTGITGKVEREGGRPAGYLTHKEDRTASTIPLTSTGICLISSPLQLTPQ